MVNQEILIVDGNFGLTGAEIGDLSSNPQTSIVTLTDAYPENNQAIIDELDAFVEVREGLNRAQLYLNFIFKNSADFKKNLSPCLRSNLHTYGHVAAQNRSLRNLEEDIHTTVENLTHVFDYARGMQIRLVADAETTLYLHTDFNDENEKRAVRVLSPHGTIFAPARNVMMRSQTQKIGPVYEPNGELMHAGSGLMVIRGDAIHAVHPTKYLRWVYTIDCKLRH